MDDQSSPENPPKDFNKLDLSQLQGFSFGTQWTQDTSSPREARRDERPRRGEEGESRREGGHAPAGEVRRDRRAFRKPLGQPGESTGSGTAPTLGEAPAGGVAPQEFRERRSAGGGEFRGGPRRDFRGGGPRRDGPGGGERGEVRGGPRRDFRDGPREGFREGGPRHGGGHEHGPYLSPFFNVTFYPEDTGFTALAKAIRTSCRTYELFEIARVIVGKNDRYVAVVQRKTAAEPPPAAATPAAVKPAPFFLSVPDGLPFDSEDEAISHVLGKHLGQFFDSAEAEVEPPKGNFQVINRCGVTGELLGPPNYHRYNQIVQQHHAASGGRLSLEALRARIETVRDPEVVNQWLEKMKKVTRYTWKNAPEGTTPLTFDSLEDARGYLLANARDKVVKPIETVRFHGKLLEQLPPGEIRRAIEGTLERQRRFPLDTANALRGRLRREGFTIFKKGSKGVSYVCAVKRKFRIPGQTFSDTIGALIAYVEAHPMVKASELPVKFAGIQPPAIVAAPASADTSAPTTENTAPAPAGEGTQPPLPTSGSLAPFAQGQHALSAEDQIKLHRLNGDLRWLVTEGYVTEFIDGRLFAPPPMTEARKQEVEKDEHDPENFPERPGSTSPIPPDETSSEPNSGAAANAPAADSLPPIESSVAEELPASATPIGEDEMPRV
jgi:hypothetical protein